MMDKGQKMIPSGKRANGMRKQETSPICKVCGKEGKFSHIRDHIESNHLQGVSIPCDHCYKTYLPGMNLRMHKSKFHKQMTHVCMKKK